MIRQLQALGDLGRKASLVLSAAQKKTYFVSLVFMFFSSGLELITIGLLVPFLGAVVSPQLLSHYAPAGTVFSFFAHLPSRGTVLVLGIVVLGMFAAKNVISYFLYAYQNRFVYSVATDLSRNKLQQYYSLSFPEFQKSNAAEMQREIAYIPVEFSHHIILGSMVILSEGMVVTLFTAGMAVFQFRIFLLTASTILPFVLLAHYISARYLRRARTTIQQTSPANLRILSDALSGFQEVKLYNSEEHFIERYLSGQRGLNVQLGKLNSASAIPGRLSEIFAVAGIMVVLFFYYAFEGGLTTSVVSLLTVYVAFAYRVIPSASRILNAAVQMRTYAFTADAVSPSQPPGDVDPGRQERPGTSPLILVDSIELRDIRLSYPERGTPVLDGVSWCIRKGEMVGLTGQSGSGKTSLVRILLQLLSQSSGCILLDGKVLQRDDVLGWHRLFAYVTQEPFVLADTIAANVAFDVPGSQADPDRVRQSLHQAGLSGLIGQLPEGIETRVAEKGKNLSGGQRQRLIIARALYRGAEIFVFDEAMSELDSASEQEVLESISSLHSSGKTVVVVSHHQRTVSRCDKIYSLGQGKLHPVLKPASVPMREN